MPRSPRQMHHVVRILARGAFFLIAAGFHASAFANGQTDTPRVAESTFVVSGTLVREDRTPIEGIKVMIAEAMPRHPEAGANDAGYLLTIAENSLLQNPSAVTDRLGKFSIVVDRALFTHRQEFVVVVPFFGRKAVSVVNLKPTTREYKLGEIARGGRTPVVR
jgi:hypothetical protein